MSFTESFNAKMADAAKLMKKGVDTCKVEGKVAEQQLKIKTLTKEIGNLAVIKLDNDEELKCPEIMERYEAIVEARAKIDELKAGKKNTKVICPSCGEKCANDMSYCGKCGAALKDEA